MFLTSIRKKAWVLARGMVMMQKEYLHKLVYNWDTSKTTLNLTTTITSSLKHHGSLQTNQINNCNLAFPIICLIHMRVDHLHLINRISTKCHLYPNFHMLVHPSSRIQTWWVWVALLLSKCPLYHQVPLAWSCTHQECLPHLKICLQVKTLETISCKRIENIIKWLIKI